MIVNQKLTLADAAAHGTIFVALPKVFLMVCIAKWPLIFRSALISLCTCVSACTAVSGYPTNPFNSAQDLSVLVANGGPGAIQFYYEAAPSARAALRNQIIYSRLAAYDIEYQNFQSELLKESNLANISGDLVVLGLNGAGATAGGAALKAALAAASAGVVGAKTSVNKELFFEQALPAILAQMSAGRAAKLTIIQEGLLLPDSEYPLPSALMDANAYREAGSLPSAINNLTANASAQNTDMKATQALAKRFGTVAAASRAVARGNRFSAEAAPAFARGPVVVAPADPLAFYRNLP